MTVKELFKTIKGYNDYADLMNLPHKQLSMWHGTTSYKADNYKEFVKIAKEEWIDAFVEKLLNVNIENIGDSVAVLDHDLEFYIVDIDR